MFSAKQQELLDRFSNQSDKLFSLGVIRTDSFTGEIGEFVACKQFGLIRTDRVTEAVDAHDNLGHRYQIKAKVTKNNKFTFSSNAIDFIMIDYLVIVFFDNFFMPLRILRIRSDQFPNHNCRISEAFLRSIDYEIVENDDLKLPKVVAAEIKRFGEVYNLLIANDIIRSRRIVGDIGEFYACHVLGLKLASKLNEKGVDAIDEQGIRYEIKTRRVYESGRRKSRTRRLNNLVGKSADVLIVVVLDKLFRCAGMWSIPMQNIDNPKSAHLGIVRTTPGVKIIIKSSIAWLQ